MPPVSNIGIDEKMYDEGIPVRKGTVLRMFDAKCTDFLHKFPDDNYASSPLKLLLENFQLHKTPKQSLKAAYFDLEQRHQINLYDMDNILSPFAKKGYCFRIKVYKKTLCPFDMGHPVQYKIALQYSEAIFSNDFTSDWAERTGIWDPDHPKLIFHMSTPTIGDPFGWDSSGVGTVKVTASLVDQTTGNLYDAKNTCQDIVVHVEFEFVSMGVTVDRFAGTPPIQTRDINCKNFRDDGRGASAFWTGNNFGPHGPFPGIVGLTMGMFCNFTGIVP